MESLKIAAVCSELVGGSRSTPNVLVILHSRDSEDLDAFRAGTGRRRPTGLDSLRGLA